MSLETIDLQIKDLGEVITGGTPPTKKREFYGDVVPLIKPTDMVLGQRYIGDTEESLSDLGVEKFKKRLVPKNTPCVVTIGTIGKSCLTKELSLVNQAVNCVVVDESKFDYMYIYYLMQATIYKVKALDSGTASGRENVSKSVFESIHVKVVKSKNEQKGIGQILSEYDSLIDNNSRRIAILEDMAQSLYREWFVKFRFPDHENVKFKDSPLGHIPEEWEVKKLADIVHFLRDSQKKGPVDTGTPYMGLEHFPKKSLALSEWDCVDDIGSSKLRFKKGDVLFGKIRSYQHKVGVAQTDGLCSSDTFVLRAVDKNHSSLIASVTFSDDFVAHSVQTSQGTKMPRANWDVLKEYLVVIPDEVTLKKFNSVADFAIEEIGLLSAKNRNMKKQRDMLLPKLIAGTITLTD